MVGVGEDSAEAHTSMKPVFVRDVFYCRELGTNDVLGRLDDPAQGRFDNSLQGFLVNRCAVATPY